MYELKETGNWAEVKFENGKFIRCDCNDKTHRDFNDWKFIKYVADFIIKKQDEYNRDKNEIQE